MWDSIGKSRWRLIKLVCNLATWYLALSKHNWPIIELETLQNDNNIFNIDRILFRSLCVMHQTASRICLLIAEHVYDNIDG